jgi:Protein of unknown function (DUF4038)/Putative collagen-binding domain of a collagenase
MKGLLAFLCCVLFLESGAQFQPSANGHYILRDGKNFFWLGDTGWELFHRLNREQADLYLKTRSRQGFTVIQAVVLAELDGLHTPNAYGDLPLLNDDPTKPNENYFKLVDYIIDKAADQGLAVGLLPTWGDKVNPSTWGKGPVIFNPENAAVYGRWIGLRYKNRKNIIWILGGDRNPQNENEMRIWRSMAKGILEGSGGKEKTLITYHPQPNNEGSGEYFYDDEWFSFNMFQNGHCRNTPVYDKIYSAWSRMPAKPVLDGEPIYEDHPVCFNVKELGTSNAYDVRMYAYLDLFSGAFGHTYGCHDIWQFYSADYEAVNGPHMYWTQALELTGANQMKYVRKLMESHPITERVPDQSLILENDLPASERVQATRGRDYVFVYSATGRSFTLILGKTEGKLLNMYWFNPRNGGSTKEPQVKNSGKILFTPPTSGYGQDWILILDDAAKNYRLN